MTRSLPFPRILLGPGPSSISDRVLEALGRAPIGYLDPELFTLLSKLRADLRTVFSTSNSFTLPLTGTGMAGMESCLANLLEPGDNAVICINGFFGGRMAEIATRLGANVTQVHGEWGRIIEPSIVNKAVSETPNVKLVGCVHAETSTGVRQPIHEVAEIAHRHGALFLADTVTSLGGIPVNVDEVGIDAAYSATQKCLGAPPGLSPITANTRALDAVASRKTKVSHWYFDWDLLGKYYDAPHAYHHTVPVNLLYALGESLTEIVEEGPQARYARHQAVSDQLIDGLKEFGIRPFAQEGYRLPTLNAVTIPDSVSDESAVRGQLLDRFGVEIGGGLGALKGKIWRIGTMGSSATPRNVTLLQGALKEVLNR